MLLTYFLWLLPDDILTCLYMATYCNILVYIAIQLYMAFDVAFDVSIYGYRAVYGLAINDNRAVNGIRCGIRHLFMAIYGLMCRWALRSLSAHLFYMGSRYGFARVPDMDLHGLPTWIYMGSRHGFTWVPDMDLHGFPTWIYMGSRQGFMANNGLSAKIP